MFDPSFRSWYMCLNLHFAPEQPSKYGDDIFISKLLGIEVLNSDIGIT